MSSITNNNDIDSINDEEISNNNISNEDIVKVVTFAYMRRRQRQLLLLLEEEEDEEELYELLLYKTHRACCLDAISKGQSVRCLNRQFFKAQKVRRLNRGLMYTSETLFKLKTERLNLFQRAEDEQNE